MNEFAQNVKGHVYFFSSQLQMEFSELRNVYPNKYFSQFGFYFAAVIYVFIFLNRKRYKDEFVKIMLIIAGILTQLGFYIKNLGYIDEVFVNLVHPYNLYHNGRFSFRKDSLVDGTVEYIYYLILTPFASSRESLLFGSFVMGWIVAVLSFLLVAKILWNESLLTFLLGLFLIVFHSGLNQILSSGFGNGLVNLFFLLGLLAWRESKPDFMIVVASLLPLLRIDAILYSIILLILSYLQFGGLKRVIISFICSLICIILVMSFSKFYYGHFIPTPIAFKSVPLKVLIKNSPRFPYALIINATSGTNSLLIPLILYFSQQKQIDKRFRNLLIAYILLLLISGFYFIQARINSSDRYYLPLYFVANLSIVFGASQLISQNIQNWYYSNKLVLKFSFVMLTLLNIQSGLDSRRYALTGKDFLLPLPFDGIVSRTFKIADEAKVLNELLTDRQVIATTELNTLGYFGNFIIDPIWGYANREIATSKIHVSFGGEIRALPNYVLRSKPDFFWLYHITPNIHEKLIKDDTDNQFYSFAPGLGIASIVDLAKEFPHIFVISRRETNVCLLVRDSSLNNLLTSLEEKDYKLIFKRPTNFFTIQQFSKQSPLQFTTY